MNHSATRPETVKVPAPAFRDSYHSSSVELWGGATVSEISLGHLPNHEVSELLRMRNVWVRR